VSLGPGARRREHPRPVDGENGAVGARVEIFRAVFQVQEACLLAGLESIPDRDRVTVDHGLRDADRDREPLLALDRDEQEPVQEAARDLHVGHARSKLFRRDPGQDRDVRVGRDQLATLGAILERANAVPGVPHQRGERRTLAPGDGDDVRELALIHQQPLVGRARIGDLPVGVMDGVAHVLDHGLARPEAREDAPGPDVVGALDHEQPGVRRLAFTAGCGRADQQSELVQVVLSRPNLKMRTAMDDVPESDERRDENPDWGCLGVRGDGSCPVRRGADVGVFEVRRLRVTTYDRND
jgi:hypothetical protein